MRQDQNEGKEKHKSHFPIFSYRFTYSCCEFKSFYCSIDEHGKFRLRRDHEYYHQVQVQLFVSSDLYSWCDFCVYTKHCVMVEGIIPDYDWIERNIHVLKKYFVCHILPEILHPVLKPPYYL